MWKFRNSNIKPMKSLLPFEDGGMEKRDPPTTVSWECKLEVRDGGIN